MKGSVVIIDGYNALGKLTHQDREHFIQLIVQYKKNKNYEMIIFFDGTHQGTQFGDQFIVENVKVVYTPLFETADDHMISFMEENAHRTIICVSSDKKIQKAAHANGFVSISSSDFIKKLNRPTLGEDDFSSQEESVWDPPSKKTTKKKGNPKKLSKKERKKKSILKKI